MENVKYLGENQLQHIAGMCEHMFSKEAKKTLKRLQDKYKIVFTLDKQTNVNLLWRAYADSIMTANHRDIRYNRTFAEAVKMTNGMNIEARDILTAYIKQNHDEDYNFILEFNINALIERINRIARQAGLHYYSEDLSELLNANNYLQLFSAKFGIAAVNAKAMKATTKALKAFDELLQGIENKADFFTALATYYQNNDLSELHNTIHTS